MVLACDIDGCLGNFIQKFLDEAHARGYGGDFPKSWTEWFSHHNNSEGFRKTWDEVNKDHDFWLSLEVHTGVPDLWPIEVAGYVTARPIPSEISAEWLDRNNFPKAKVITTGLRESKVPAIRSLGADTFIEDKWDNFLDINNSGIDCFLVDRPWNRTFDAGTKRIYSIGEIFDISI